MKVRECLAIIVTFTIDRLNCDGPTIAYGILAILVVSIDRLAHTAPFSTGVLPVIIGRYQMDKINQIILWIIINL